MTVIERAYTSPIWYTPKKGPMKMTDMKAIALALGICTAGTVQAQASAASGLDASYMKLEGSGTATRTGAGPIGATASANADLEIKQTTFAAAIAYRVKEGRAPLDVVAGMRYLEIEASARIDASFFALTRSVEVGAKKSWGDPYIGLRLQQPLDERWTLLSYADIGGFGVASDFTWQALLGVNYDFSKSIAGKAGYRMMGVDYDKDGFAYDMTYSGLYFGLGIRF